MSLEAQLAFASTEYVDLPAKYVAGQSTYDARKWQAGCHRTSAYLRETGGNGPLSSLTTAEACASRRPLASQISTQI